MILSNDDSDHVVKDIRRYYQIPNGKIKLRQPPKADPSVGAAVMQPARWNDVSVASEKSRERMW